jgi:hypothetical protein
METDTTLQSEVEIHFKSDYFPLERFAPAGTVNKIQGNTAVPEANAPFAAPPAVGSTLPTAAPSRLAAAPAMPAMPSLPAMPGPSAGKLPDKPIDPNALQPVHKVAGDPNSPTGVSDTGPDPLTGLPRKPEPAKDAKPVAAPAPAKDAKPVAAPGNDGKAVVAPAPGKDAKPVANPVPTG